MTDAMVAPDALALPDAVTDAPQDAGNLDVADALDATDPGDLGGTGMDGGDGGGQDARALDVPVPGDTAVLDTPSVPDAMPMDGGSRCPPGMALIPGGMFQMGDPLDDDAPSHPVHGVRVSAFCMDVTEVTVAAYGLCHAAGCTVPGTTGRCNQGMAGRDAHPVNCVTWTQARAYCQWRGADLPTEAQWEYAARGTDGRLFPWGADTPAAQLCWSGGGPPRTSTCPVGSFPTGATPAGLVDMAGNVWEWTLDWYGAYVGEPATFVSDPTGAPTGISRINRGGSFGNTLSIDVRATIRFGGMPSRAQESIGFRCAAP